jgi:hypothetical protein
VVIHESRQKIIGHADRVKVSGEVQVNIFHRQHLRVTAAGSSTFHAKARTEARLAQTDDRSLPKFVEGITEANRCRGLSFSRRCRGNGGNKDQLAVGLFV